MSRRLARRLTKDLRAGNYGYVKLAVQTYIHLLKESRPELSSLFATEIVVKTAVSGWGEGAGWLLQQSCGATPHATITTVMVAWRLKVGGEWGCSKSREVRCWGKLTSRHACMVL